MIPVGVLDRLVLLEPIELVTDPSRLLVGGAGRFVVAGLLRSLGLLQRAVLLEAIAVRARLRLLPDLATPSLSKGKPLRLSSFRKRPTSWKPTLPVNCKSTPRTSPA